MTWLRLDDKFERHYKVSGLTDRAFRIWIRTLLYCVEYRTNGLVPVRAPIPGLTPAMRERFRNDALLDVIEGEDWVHDFAEYNPKDPTAADRMRKFRQRNSDVTELSLDRNDAVTETVTRAQPRARGPSRPLARAKALAPDEQTAATNGRPADPLWDAFDAELGPVVTKSERGRRNAALKELRAVDATAEEIRSRCAAYRATWPTMTLTETALVAHWSALAQPVHYGPDEAYQRLRASMAARGVE